MVGAGSFNQHLDPCFTNSALPPPISKLSTPRPDPGRVTGGGAGPDWTRDAESFRNIFSSQLGLKSQGRDERWQPDEFYFISSKSQPAETTDWGAGWLSVSELCCGEIVRAAN